MTRRLVAAILGTVVGALLVAGALTVVIARWQAEESTEEVLRQQAESLAFAGAAVDPAAPPREQVVTRRLLREVRQALRVDGVEFVAIDSTGQLTGALPEGVAADDLDLAALRSGQTVSGTNGSLVYAAAPQQRPRSTVVAVVTREATSTVGDALPWFVLASVVTLALGTVVAVLVGRRLARPVDAAADAAHRIAAGDLAVRLPQPADQDGDELAGLARSINIMASALERSKEVERQFLLSISHDLRTPLTSIRGYAGAIADGTASDTAAAAEVIVAESARLERLVSDLLDLARLDSHTFSLHPVEHDLRITLVDSVRAAGPYAERQGIAVTVDDGGAVPVMADEARVRQLLGNVLENAVKYAGARGRGSRFHRGRRRRGPGRRRRPRHRRGGPAVRLRPALRVTPAAGTGGGRIRTRAGDRAPAGGGDGWIRPCRLVTLRRGPHRGAPAARLHLARDAGDHTPLRRDGGERTERSPPS